MCGDSPHPHPNNIERAVMLSGGVVRVHLPDWFTNGVEIPDDHVAMFVFTKD